MDSEEWQLLRRINEETGKTYWIAPDRCLVDGVTMPVWSVIDNNADRSAGDYWETPVAWGCTAKEAIMRAAYRLGVLTLDDE